MASKTIALDERVWRRLKEMRNEEKVDSLGEVIARLIEKRKGVPPSMFGVDTGRNVKLTQRMMVLLGCVRRDCWSSVVRLRQ
jgi:predicted CopG family antitoxin